MLVFNGKVIFKDAKSNQAKASGFAVFSVSLL